MSTRVRLYGSMGLPFAEKGKGITMGNEANTWVVIDTQLKDCGRTVRREPGEALLVNLEGTIAMRPKIEGEGTQPTLIVEHFKQIGPDETCGPGNSTAMLEKT